MAALKLNKQLYTNINGLKLINKSELHGCFILDQSPFDDEELSTGSASSEEVAAVGRIFPNTEIYNQGSYEIKLTFTSSYPHAPPKVKFLTKIYHPNIADDGEKERKKCDNTLTVFHLSGVFCYELLDQLGGWSRTHSLADIIQTVIKYLNQPDLEMFEVQRTFIK